MDFLPSLEAFIEAGFILFTVCGTLVVLNGVRIFIRNRWFSETDFWGDKIRGRWRGLVKPGARHMLHAFANERCNYCGQKNLALLEYTDYPYIGTPVKKPLKHDDTRDYLCGACGVKINLSLYELEGKVLRGCTDPIPELRRPATHAQVDVPREGVVLSVRINICKTCDGSKFVNVPYPSGDLWAEYEKARCPDCYRTDDDAPPAKMSNRRRAIEHTKALP
jgi:DNA-directed RNA polymerase subunit RPC12/RpoP